jgi:hypothetical protein
VFRFEPRAAEVTVVQPKEMVVVALGDGNVYVQPKDGYGAGFYISKERQLSIAVEEGPFAGYLIAFEARADGTMVRVVAIKPGDSPEEDDVPGTIAASA